MGAVIVKAQMQLQFTGYRRVDGFKKATKLSGAMTPMELADHRPGLGIERREEIGGAVFRPVP